MSTSSDFATAAKDLGVEFDLRLKRRRTLSRTIAQVLRGDAAGSLGHDDFWGSRTGLMADPEGLGRWREGTALSVRRFSVMRAAVSEYATFAEAHADHGREVSAVAKDRRGAPPSGGPA